MQFLGMCTIRGPEGGGAVHLVMGPSVSYLTLQGWLCMVWYGVWKKSNFTRWYVCGPGHMYEVILLEDLHIQLWGVLRGPRVLPVSVYAVMGYMLNWMISRGVVFGYGTLCMLPNFTREVFFGISYG